VAPSNTTLGALLASINTSIMLIALPGYRGRRGPACVPALAIAGFTRIVR
jgi:hypothetical protein